MGEPITVGLDIFDRVNELKISSNVDSELSYVTERYFDYLEELKNLVERDGFSEATQDAFLLRMKSRDIRENHLIEKEDSLLIDMYLSLSKPNVTDRVIKRDGKPLTVRTLKSYHHLLLEGTSSAEDINNYVRKNNEAFVGTYNLDGSKNIQYMPVDYHDACKALALLAEYYNNNTLINISDIFKKPFLFHALVACLQVFRDGNTRFARVLQHTKIWELTNVHNMELDNGSIHLKMPALYLTSPYKLYRGQYREIISSLVVDNKDEDWNNWILFNLYRADEALFKAENELEKVKQRKLSL